MSLTSGKYPRKIVYLDEELIAEIYSGSTGEKDKRDKLPRGEFMVHATDNNVSVLEIDGNKIPVVVWKSIGKHGEMILNLLTVKNGVVKSVSNIW